MKMMIAILVAVLSAGFTAPVFAENDLDPDLASLGEKLFFDKISDPDSMSCAECHAPNIGWTGPTPGINKHGAVYRGAVPSVSVIASRQVRDMRLRHRFSTMMNKVPTLRNVALRPGNGFPKAYVHNGVFKTLAEVVKFYDEREEMLAMGHHLPEVAENVNTEELGDLGLTDEEEAALVAFMETLSDGWTPRGKK